LASNKTLRELLRRTRRLPDSFMDRNTFGSNVAAVRCIADGFRNCQCKAVQSESRSYGMSHLSTYNFPSLEPASSLEPLYCVAHQSPEKCYSEAIVPFYLQGFVNSEPSLSSSCSAKQAFSWSMFCCVQIPCFVNLCLMSSRDEGSPSGHHYYRLPLDR
jgi:hypothetical protein